LAAFRNGLPTRQQDAAVDLHDFDVGRLIDLPLAHEEPRRVRRHRGKDEASSSASLSMRYSTHSLDKQTVAC